MILYTGEERLEGGDPNLVGPDGRQNMTSEIQGSDEMEKAICLVPQ